MCYTDSMKNFFDYEIKHDGVTVQFSDSLSIIEREIHSYHEILFCDAENVILRTENIRTEIPGKSLVIIPKGSYHSFDISEAESFERIKISLSEELLSKLSLNLFLGGVSVVFSLTQSVALLTRKLCEILKGNKSEGQALFAFSTVMVLLSELDASEAKHSISMSNTNSATEGIINYVSRHLSGDLSVDAISKALRISPSFLTHNFKKDVGISLHRYVTGKRMAYAKERIDLGERPSKIYTDFGYNDYSSFYKAYYLFHGEAPSKK